MPEPLPAVVRVALHERGRSCDPQYTFRRAFDARAVGAVPRFCAKCQRYHRDYTARLPREALTATLGEVANG